MHIEKTVENDLCMGCGICAGACPTGAISFKFQKGFFIPSVSNQCIDCGICLDCCPGIKVDFNVLENEIINEDNVISGKIIESYNGKVRDKKLLKKCASGGVISGIIVELLNAKLVDYAAVLKYNPNENPAYMTITNDIVEVQEASKSKYIPSNMKFVVEHLIKNRDKKYIIVGTSCQIQGIRYVINKYRLNKDNIILLGLFCELTMNYNFSRFYEDTFCNGDSIDILDYKSKEYGGWPGNTRLVTKSGKTIIIDKTVRIRLKEIFQLSRCRYCIDKLNQFSDISFGDCYNKGQTDPEGKSSILVRTELGAKVLEHCKNLLILEDVDVKMVHEAQKINEKLVYLKRARKLDINIYKGIEHIKDKETNFKMEFKFKLKNSLGAIYNKNPRFFGKIIKKFILKEKINNCIIEMEN